MRLAILLRRIVMKRLPEDGGLDVERWGLRMRLHPRHNGCEKGLLFTPQFFEAGERAELASRIASVIAGGRPFVFIDIGANVGLFSLYVASCAGDRARIVAVEPNHETLQRLYFNIASNPKLAIRALPVALGETAGTLALEVNRVDYGGTRTRPWLDAESKAGTQVECKTLVEMLAQEGVASIDALKIDVEGAEDRVLVPFFKEAPKSLWPRFILIEDSRESWRTDLFAELETRGYKIAARTKLNVMLEL
jgi:FkbM family methyltransferase